MSSGAPVSRGLPCDARGGTMLHAIVPSHPSGLAPSASVARVVQDASTRSWATYSVSLGRIGRRISLRQATGLATTGRPRAAQEQKRLRLRCDIAQKRLFLVVRRSAHLWSSSELTSRQTSAVQLFQPVLHKSIPAGRLCASLSRKIDAGGDPLKLALF